MTLADAKATALAGTLRENEPRIERAGYVGAVDGLAALGSVGASDVYLYDRVIPLHSHLVEGGGPIIVLELSQLGMDILGVGAGYGAAPASEAENCSPVPGDRRYAVSVVYYPRTARMIGHTYTPLPEALWAVASAGVDPVIASATPQPNATPLQHSPPVPSKFARPAPTSLPAPLIDPAWPATPLGVGEYPVALRDMIAAWPLVVGSTWTYQAKAHRDALTWRTWTFTETVVAATRRGPEVMEVTLGPGWFDDRDHPWGRGPSNRRPYLIVRPDAVLHDFTGDDRVVTQDEVLAPLLPPGAPGEYDTPLKAMVRLPLTTDTSDGAWWRDFRVEPVVSTAGTFPSCHLLTEVFNAGNAFGHWLCPGVGFARHELPGCGMRNGSYAVFDLIDYTIPPLVAVE